MNPWLEALQEMDAREDLVMNDWEERFVDGLLTQMPHIISPKQQRVILRMVERYLSPTRAAELYGQKRLL